MYIEKNYITRYKKRFIKVDSIKNLNTRKWNEKKDEENFSEARKKNEREDIFRYIKNRQFQYLRRFFISNSFVWHEIWEDMEMCTVAFVWWAYRRADQKEINTSGEDKIDKNM